VDVQGQVETVRRPVGLPSEERERMPLFDEEQAVSDHPQRAFVDVADAAGGRALPNRGLPEDEAAPTVDGVLLGLTLLRGVGWLSRGDLSSRYQHAGRPLRTPKAQCPGRQRFAYALVPHGGDWLAGGVAGAPQHERAWCKPRPLPPRTRDQPSVTHLPPVPSWYRLQPEELRFNASKPSDDGDGIVLRAYDAAPYPLAGSLVHSLAADVRWPTSRNARPRPRWRG